MSATRSSRRRPSRTGRLEKGVAIITAVIGALAGVVGLIDWAGGLGGNPPPHIDARIERVAQRDVAEPLRHYLADTRQTPRGYSASQLDQRGYVFDVSVRIIGQRAKKFPLRWTLYRLDPETRVQGRSYDQIAGEMKPASDDHASTWPVWVPYPPQRGTYVVRFTLEDQRERPVSEARSPRFRYPPR